MDRIADEMLDDGSLRSALRRMLQHGAEFPSGNRMMGMQELLDRLRQARAGNLDRYNLGSSLDDIIERLNNVIDTERHGIQHRLGEDDDAGEQDAEPNAEDGGQEPGEGTGDGEQGSSGRPQGAR